MAGIAWSRGLLVLRLDLAIIAAIWALGFAAGFSQLATRVCAVMIGILACAFFSVVATTRFRLVAALVIAWSLVTFVASVAGSGGGNNVAKVALSGLEAFLALWALLLRGR